MPIPGAAPVGRQVVGQISDTTTPPMSWFMPLSEPVRTRPGSAAAAREAFSFAPLPIVPRDWFVPLSEPARKRPALNAAQVPFAVIDTTVIPVSKLFWFMPLSEPVRKLSGLDAARQQFLAAPSRLLPTPTVTGALSATETGDTFQGGGQFWNRIVSGEVGASEKAFTGAQVAAVVVAPSVGTSGMIEATAAPSVGAAVPVITKASVAIIIR